MIESVRNAFRLPDLRQKILITIGILFLYRFAANIPLPGVDRDALDTLFGAGNNNILVNLLNFFSGGGLRRMGVMALGVYPYVTASIIMQLLQPIVPALEELAKEGEQGRNRLNQYTYWLTVPLAFLQAIAQATLLSRGAGGVAVLPNWGFTGDNLLPSLTIIIGMTAGTMFGVWLGQLLTEQGIGNGLSLIIFAGILASVPAQIGQLWQQPVLLVVFILITILTMAVIVWIQEGQRRIPVQYGKRVRTMRGNRMMMVGGQSTYVPLRVNTAGMIPLIFAQSLLILPSTVASYFVARTGVLGTVSNWVTQWIGPTSWIYWLLYFLFTVAFTYFYTDVMFRQQNLPESLQKQGGFIPGIRPGPRTESYLYGVVSRITLAGALFLGFVAVLPYVIGTLVDSFTGGGNVLTSGYDSLIISSTGLLIVVGVVLDTMKQIEAQLMMRNYEGFIR